MVSASVIQRRCRHHYEDHGLRSTSILITVNRRSAGCGYLVVRSWQEFPQDTGGDLDLDQPLTSLLAPQTDPAVRAGVLTASL